MGLGVCWACDYRILSCGDSGLLGEVVEVQSPVATVFYSCSVQGLLQGVPLGELSPLKSLSHNSFQTQSIENKTQGREVWGRMDTCIYLTGSPSLTVQLKLSEHCLLIASVYVCTKSLQSCLTLCDSMGCSLPGSSGRKESWNGLPCPPPGDRLNPGVQPKSPVAPVLQADLFFFF